MSNRLTVGGSSGIFIIVDFAVPGIYHISPWITRRGLEEIFTHFISCPLERKYSMRETAALHLVDCRLVEMIKWYDFKDLLLFCTLKPVKEAPMYCVNTKEFSVVIFRNVLPVFCIMLCKLNGSFSVFQCFFLTVYSNNLQHCNGSLSVKSWSETVENALHVTVTHTVISSFICMD